MQSRSGVLPRATKYLLTKKNENNQWTLVRERFINRQRMFRYVQKVVFSVQRHFGERIVMNFPFYFRPQLAGLSPAALGTDGGQTTSSLDDLSVWFAVPKKRVTRHKKRLKTTVQKRIPLRKNIVNDPRTGEVTLMHRLPFNWKKYLPKVDE